MVDRLEEALVEVLARIEAGENLSTDDLRAGYPDCWQEIRDVFEVGRRAAEIGRSESASAKARGGAETKLRVVDADRYERFHVLGEGGMGTVYWALDTELNREVAFKVVRSGTSASSTPTAPIHVAAPAAGTPAARAFETLKARFLQEAWVTAGLEHPGIVPVYEVGQTPEGVPFYTMRFVRGSRTLTQAMDEGKARPSEERLALLDTFLRVCDTMRYAHAHGVIHRDLKPDNVALGEFGEVVVLDWGIAKIRDRPDATAETWKHRLDEFREATDLRTKAHALGTPGYMSPEAAAGRIDEVDERSDVYSLGAILFQLLTGRLPYVFGTYEELLTAMDDAAPPAPHSLDATVPLTLSAICLRALARERDARPASVDALATEVRVWIAKRARDHEIEVLEREAIVATAAMADLQGEALLRQLNRVHAAATKLLDRAPENETARGLLREAESQRELGIRQRERTARRRTARRALIVGLAAALAGTAGAAFVVRTQQQRTAHALGEVRTQRDARAAALLTARAVALANASKAAESIDPMRALLLAREAARVEMSPAVVSQLHSALVGSLEDVVFRGHTGRLASTLFSPVDDSVLTASGDHTARIWNADGTVRARLVGHERSLYCAAFSRAGDRVVTGSEDCTARIWDLSGKQLRILEGHTDTVNSVAYSPNGELRIATGSFDGTARLWDADGNRLAVLAGHRGPLNNLAWSPKGDMLATASEDGDVRIWDAKGAPLAVLPHDHPVSSVAFSPDGAVLLTGAADGWRLWDVAAARPTVIHHESLPVDSIAFSPEGSAFATATGGIVSVWNVRGDLVAELLGHTSEVWCVTFSPDGTMVAATGSWDGSACVWDLKHRGVTVFHANASWVGTVQFSPGFTPDRGRLLTAYGDGTARTWRLKGAEVETYRSVSWGLRALAVSGVGDQRVLVVPITGPAFAPGRNGEPEIVYGEPNERLRSAKFSADGRRVVTGGQDGWVHVFECNGDKVKSFPAHQRSCSADFSPDGTRILTWSYDGTAKLWDLAGRCLHTFDEHEDRVESAAFSPNGRTIVTGSWDRCARIFDVDTGKLVRTMRGHAHTVFSVAFSHLGDRVLTASLDATVKIWDLEGHALHTLPHASGTSVAAFSLDDSLVAVGCDDGSTWLWNAASGDLLSLLPGHSACVIAVEFERDGRTLATACQDGNVRVRCILPEDVLAIVRHKITREFTHAEIEQYKVLLGHDYDTLVAAYDYIEPRLARAVVVTDVAAEVSIDAGLGDEVRAAALRVLALRRDDGEQVRERTWEVVREAGRTEATYRDALRWALVADDLLHDNPSVRVLLGVAQHRTGDETAALQTLEAVDSKFGDASGWPHLTCIAALALVHHAMGDDDKARAELGRFDGLRGKLTGPEPFRYRVFLDEARALQRELGTGK